MQDYGQSSGLAQHVMVSGSGESIFQDFPVPTLPTQSSGSTVQQEHGQGPFQSQPPNLAPRSSTIRVQCFSGQVAERIEVLQRRSTRAVYEAKWSIFV